MRRLFMGIAALAALSGVPSNGQASDATGHFCETYGECRDRFLEHAERAVAEDPRVVLGRFPIRSAVDPDLAVDYAYWPPTATPRGLVIVVSGTHGPEGFLGSAVQDLLIETVIPHADRASLGFLMIHGLNPFGFKYGRRVTENNVDLNRNFGLDPTLFQTPNPVYLRVKDVINPPTAASMSGLQRTRFNLAMAVKTAQFGEALLTQSIARGQYDVARGIFYGGDGFEPQRDLIDRLFAEIAVSYEKVLLLDIHTGLGDRGRMHLLPNPAETDELRQAWREIFGDYPIDDGNERSDFYEPYGHFSNSMCAALRANGPFCVPMLIEYGTLDSQTTLGKLDSLYRIVQENQMYWHGADDASAEAIRTRYREMFFPSEKRWREDVMRQTKEHLPEFIARFAAFSSSR